MTTYAAHMDIGEFRVYGNEAPQLRLLMLPFIGLAALAALPGLAGKNIFVFAGYFLLGFPIATDDAILDTVVRHRLAYLGLTLLGTAGILVEAFTVGRQDGLLATVLYYPVYWAALLAILGYGKRHLDRSSKVMDYITPAALPIYILHQTFLVIAGYYLLRLRDSGPVPYLLILVTALIFSLATYEVIRRIRPLRFLFGLAPMRTAVSSPQTAVREPNAGERIHTGGDRQDTAAR